MEIKVTAPLTKEEASKLKSGDIVKITGTIYTARDAAHKRMIEDYEKTGKFPFDMENAVNIMQAPHLQSRVSL